MKATALGYHRHENCDIFVFESSSQPDHKGCGTADEIAPVFPMPADPRVVVAKPAANLRKAAATASLGLRAGVPAGRIIDAPYLV